MTIGDFISALGLITLVFAPIWLLYISWKQKSDEKLIRDTIERFKQMHEEDTDSK